MVNLKNGQLKDSRCSSESKLEEAKLLVLGKNPYKMTAFCERPDRPRFPVDVKIMFSSIPFILHGRICFTQLEGSISLIFYEDPIKIIFNILLQLPSRNLQ